MCRLCDEGKPQDHPRPLSESRRDFLPRFVQLNFSGTIVAGWQTALDHAHEPVSRGLQRQVFDLPQPAGVDRVGYRSGISVPGFPVQEARMLSACRSVLVVRARIVSLRSPHEGMPDAQ